MTSATFSANAGSLLTLKVPRGRTGLGRGKDPGPDRGGHLFACRPTSAVEQPSNPVGFEATQIRALVATAGDTSELVTIARSSAR